MNKELTLSLLNNDNNNNNNNNKSIHIMHFVPPFPSVLLAMKVDRRFLCAITKTYLYNFDPLKPHFFVEKPGFTGVYITFLISAKKTYIAS